MNRRYKILLINRFWADSHVPTGRMLFDMAKYLSSQGHHITVLTTSDTYVNVSGETETLKNLKVIIVTTFGPRFFRWILFWLTTMIRPLFMEWDRCVVLTDPPFMNFMAIWDRWFCGSDRKRYWWVMDLFPDMISASDVYKKHGLFDRFFRFFTDLSLKALDGVIVLDEAQRRRLSGYENWRKGTGYSLLVPPWDFRRIQSPARGRNRFLELSGLRRKKIILYAGNLGRAHVFEPLLSAAKELLTKGKRDWLFLFVCRGYRRKHLEIAAQGLSNVQVMDYVSPDVTSDMLFAASVHVITLGPDWDGICVPSKLYGILPTKRPVLFIGPSGSGTAQEILKYRAGKVLPLDATPSVIARTIETMATKAVPRTYNVDKSGPLKIDKFITRP